MPDESSEPAKPSVVYVSSLRLNWKHVLIGLVIGIIIVLIGVVGAYLVSYGFKFTSGEPTNNVPTKTSTSSAKQATP
ncbi:MAG: hypothetical protein Q8O75_00065, partial [bacterium]|nr:hypothetical protein [bacterium]